MMELLSVPFTSRGWTDSYEAMVTVHGLLRNEPEGLVFEFRRSEHSFGVKPRVEDPIRTITIPWAEIQSLTYRRRIRVEVAVTVEDPHVPSAVSVYPTADWHERETYDFFGIRYDGHPGLTRIEMPDDWEGHPQRKDYPLGGIPVEYKGAQIPPPDERRVYQ